MAVFGKILIGLGILGLLIAIPVTLIALSYFDVREMGPVAAVLSLMLYVIPLVTVSLLLLILGTALLFGANGKPQNTHDPVAQNTHDPAVQDTHDPFVVDYYHSSETDAGAKEKPTSNWKHKSGNALFVLGVLVLLSLIIGRSVLVTKHTMDGSGGVFGAFIIGLVLCLAGLLVAKKANSKRP